MTDAERTARRREEVFLLFHILQDDTAHNLNTIASSYFAGSVSAWHLSQAFVTVLHDSHSHAAYLGRRLAGRTQPYGSGDQAFASSVMIGQGQFLRGLVSDILTGRYLVGGGGALAAALVQRLRLYAARLRATALEAWLLNLPTGTMVRWVLQPAEHCQSCVERAAGSPYDARTIPWTPSDGSSECGVNCKCTLETMDGEPSFAAG